MLFAVGTAMLPNRLKEGSLRVDLQEGEDLLHKGPLHEGHLQGSIRIKLGTLITGSRPLDKILPVLHHKGAIPKEEDRNIQKKRGMIKDNPGLNFRERIIRRDMTEEERVIHLSKEEIPGSRTEILDTKIEIPDRKIGTPDHSIGTLEANR